MKERYTDLYALFRHDPGAEAYFNDLPEYVQDQLSARYQAVDSMERLLEYAARAQNHSFELHYPAEEIGGRAFLPSPVKF